MKFLGVEWADVVSNLGIGAIVGAILAYFSQRFTKSGNIRTTEADDLWSEARQLRLDLSLERDMLRTELANVRIDAERQRQEYEGKIDALQRILDRSKLQIEQLQDEITLLRGSVAAHREEA